MTTLGWIDPNDHWRDLTPQQIVRFLHELQGWAPSYDVLVGVLSKRELKARVLVGKEVILPDEIEFQYAPAVPTMHSGMRAAVSYCVDLIFKDSDVKYLGLLDYMLDANEDITKTTSELGGGLISISGEPIFLFPRGSAGLGELDLYRSFHHSLVVGLRDRSLETITDLFAYVFDQETVLYLDASTFRPL